MPVIGDRSEGDLNLTPFARAWRARTKTGAAGPILREDERYFVHQALSTPCLNAIQACSGIYLETADGRKIIDFHGNNVHQVGFGHPRVVEAVKAQLEILPFCTRRFTNVKVVELAKKLADLAPGDLNKVLLAPAATLAVSTALKLARAATGRYKTLSVWDSFHGASLDAITVGGQALFRRGMGPLLPGAEHVPPVDPYHCPLKECSGEGSCACAGYLEYVLAKDGEIGAVILETVRNTDVVIPPPWYYQRVREACDQHGALLILDETAVGLGRTGRMFAFEHWGIVPDMVILGKGLGGGVFPLAALVVREGLDVAGEGAVGHYTHEKTPLGAAAALAVMEVIKEEGLLERAVALGRRMGRRLKNWPRQYSLVGDVRGIGFLYGVELVKDRRTKEPATSEAEAVMYRCLEKGLNFKVSRGNVLTLSPPLIIGEEELDRALDILEESLQEVMVEYGYLR
ncbi:aspartate aminotransferase family protein [Kyrpidia spormannii]|uniref:Aspartate aminotransferase family protein n=1 Tax=Kyrpidia spormannii TaxID=2055160 RepID=A0A2K8N698_9BACL|nr:aspartate aminotransferase family protein [Kyrpidia spormannii]ATY84615.1 aspartate aminotransferase family protein [Kyrpidia spormannii]